MHGEGIAMSKTDTCEGDTLETEHDGEGRQRRTRRATTEDSKKPSVVRDDARLENLGEKHSFSRRPISVREPDAAWSNPDKITTRSCEQPIEEDELHMATKIGRINTEALAQGDDVRQTKSQEGCSSPKRTVYKRKETKKSPETAQPSSRPSRPRQERRTFDPPMTESDTDGWPACLVAAGVVLIVGLGLALVLWRWHSPSVEAEKPTLDPVEKFWEEMGKMRQSFQRQQAELWRRSKIHLQRHLRTAQPSEPVSLILVGGQSAERTLGCLASHLAQAFSLALNGSVLQVDGSQMAKMDHEQVKLDLDNQLRRAFEGNQPAAVIHRLDELPPSSTLIFYRYCDHENAAYKHPLLAFTVVLPQEEVGPELSLSQVEEMAHRHIQHKFLNTNQPDGFDSMDVDKLSGLWSRISHLILPVNTEEQVEKHGCEESRRWAFLNMQG